MKILKHGKYFGKFEIKCQICGCVYEACGPDDLIYDYFCTNLNEINLATVRITCPECGAFEDFKLQDTNNDEKMI